MLNSCLNSQIYSFIFKYTDYLCSFYVILIINTKYTNINVKIIFQSDKYLKMFNSCLFKFIHFIFKLIY